MLPQIDFPLLTLTLDDMLITTKLPRLQYRKREHHEKKSVHWGQRKLLLSEVQFLTLFHNPNEVINPVIVYAGAGPGIHIKFLVEMFPNFIYHLYDPVPFSKNLDNVKNIFTYQRKFTDEDAYKWSNLDNIYFISDIRTADFTKMNETQVEEFVSSDMTDQLRWYNIIKPISALLKFRLPWPGLWPTEGYEYPAGYLFKQVWSPQSSTEGRLVPFNGETISWDIKAYEEMMFYHNVIVREQFKYVNEAKDEPQLIDDYDSTAEVFILKEYLNKYGIVSSENIITLSQNITKNLNYGMPKQKWVTLNKTRTKHKRY